MSTLPSSPATRTVRVAFGDGRGYDVVIGSGVLREAPDRVVKLTGGPRPWFIVADSGVPDATQSILLQQARQLNVRCFRSSWTPSESAKDLRFAGEILQDLSENRLERGCPIIALGGGITGDIAGFAAAIYQRGTPWVNCPTTLLAMVDASVGGKTGVNLHSDSEGSTYKNMIGAFHQPTLVMADVATLASLPDRVFRAGLAECIKHGMIGSDWGDPTLLDWTKANLASILKRDQSSLIELISRNIAVKASVVAADERETGTGPGGGRMALNLGHTFAHAIETLAGLTPDGEPAHSPLQHGEAVGLGLIAAATCARALGVCSPALVSEVTALVAACELPIRIAGLPDDQTLIARMLHDKKVRDTKLRLIVPTERGRTAVLSDPKTAAVGAALSAIRAS